MKKLILLMCFGLFVSLAHAENKSPETQVKSAITKASKIRKLPKSNSMVTFSNQGEALVIADNPRWVVKGRLFDMWQNEEIRSENTLKIAEVRIPLSKIKVNTSDILDVVVNQEKSKTLTVFLDPFLDNSSSVVSILTTYATDYRIRFIVTAMSESSIKPLGLFNCFVMSQSSEKIITAIITHKFPTQAGTCGQQNMMKTYGLSQFLHISVSPTLIAPNEVYHEGMPGKLMAWLEENKE